MPKSISSAEARLAKGSAPRAPARLEDPRSQLALCYLGIAARYRPRFLVWEKRFPEFSAATEGGTLAPSSGAWLNSGTGSLGGCLTLATSEHADFPGGLPTKRRRVFLVGCLGDAVSAAELLVERGCLSGSSCAAWRAERSLCRPGSRRRWRAGFGAGKHIRPYRLRQVYRRGSAARASGGDQGGGSEALIAVGGDGVRKLSALECERVMGFKDGWTDIQFRGRPAAHGPRTKALGNSWAVNCGEWVFDRVKAQVEAGTGQGASA